jgi:hypothetical protein
LSFFLVVILREAEDLLLPLFVHIVILSEAQNPRICLCLAIAFALPLLLPLQSLLGNPRLQPWAPLGRTQKGGFSPGMSSLD